MNAHVRRRLPAVQPQSRDRASDRNGDAIMNEPATRVRRSSLRDIVAVLVVVAASLAGAVMGAVVVLLWAQLSRTPMRELGFKAPANWFRVLTWAATIGVALKLALKALVMPLLGAPAVNASYQYLTGNTAALPGMVAGLLLAGIAEELLYRGYVFERFRALLRSGQGALYASIVVSTAVFSIAHYSDQGLPGMAQAAITGLAFATMFAWQRHIWFPIVAHITFNLTSVALIYGNWEQAVARAVFR